MEEVRNPSFDSLRIIVPEHIQSKIVGYADTQKNYWSFTPAVHTRFLETMQSAFGKNVVFGYGEFDLINAYLFDNSIEFQLLYTDEKYAVEIIVHGDPFSDDEHIAVLSLYETLDLTSQGQPK